MAKDVEKKQETVTLTKEQFDQLTGSLDFLKAKVENLEKNPPKAGIETAQQRFAKDIHARMKGETNAEAQRSIVIVEEPAEKDGQYIVDMCPWCVKANKNKPEGFDPKTSSLLDITNGGKYSCRRCGKHWHPWAIFPETYFPEYGLTKGPLPYSIHVEQGNFEKVENQLKLEAARKGEPVK